MHNRSWDDLRFVLAVAESGSVSAAARDLGVNHATVLRRIAAFEEANGTEVFERGPTGYRLRPEMARLIDAARSAAQSIDLVGRIAQGRPEQDIPVMRLTSVDSICHALLGPKVGAIEQRIAPTRIELISSNLRLDLSRLEADVTVRPSRNLPEPLVGDVVFNMDFGLYEGQVSPGVWLGLSGPLLGSDVAAWMFNTVTQDQIGGRADSFVILREMAASGQGKVILPRFLGDNDPRLQERPEDLPAITIPVWVACHRDLKSVARVRDLMDAVTLEIQCALAS